jgi:hypothetical protein
MNTILLIALAIPADVVLEDFNDFQEPTPFPIQFDDFHLYNGPDGGASSIQIDPLRGLTVGNNTPYAFFAIQDTYKPRIWFPDPINHFEADLQVGDRILCNPSKWHFLTSTQEQINDGWNANLTFYADDWSVLGNIPLYEGDPQRYFFDSDTPIRRAIFSLADRGFCQPVGMDNIGTTEVPSPSTLTAMAGLLACFSLWGVKRGRTRKRNP